MDKKTVFKLYFMWQEEEECAWLEKMSRNGWHLSTAKSPGIYTFLKGKPTNYVYDFDYNNTGQLDLDEYIETFKASGWEYIGGFNDWNYFRALEGKKISKIYSDKDSFLQKYKKILKGLYAAISLGVLSMICFIPSVILFGYPMIILFLLPIVIIVVILLGIMKIRGKISEIEGGL